MSFTDYVTNEVVSGQARVLVPILKRHVTYQKYFERVDRKTGEVSSHYFGDPIEGREIVKEVPTTQDKEEELRAKYENNFEPETKLVLLKVSKPKIEFTDEF